MTRLFVAAVLAAAALTAAGAQAPPLTPARRGAVDAVFADLGPHTPGCALGVVEDGRLAYARSYGMASLELGVPMTPATVLEIGSVSKQFTAAAIFMLAHAGKLSLDDPVQKYIPELPRYRWPVTIRELLHHTSGIRDVISLMAISGIPFNDFATQQDALALIERQRGLNFVPGSEYRYSNSGYVLLAEIVHRVAGEPFPRFAAARIFAPLGMTHTRVRADSASVIAGRAGTYAPLSGGGYRLDVSPWEQFGDGAVNTTVGDLALWMRNFSRPVVGGPWLIRDLETRGVLNDGRVISYAGGLVVDDYRGLRRVSHGGSWQGYRADFEWFPDARLGIITLCNGAATDPGGRAPRVADLLLASRLAPAPKPAPAALSDAQLQRYAGLYWSPAGHDLRQVAAREHRLWIRAAGGAPEAWLPTGAASFARAGASLSFAAGGGGMALHVGDDVLRRVVPARPSPRALRPLAGAYRSDELQVTWRVAMKDGVLELFANGANPNRLDTDRAYPLAPQLPGVFTAGPYLLEFGRAGFRVYAGRSGGMRFARAAAAAGR